MITDAEIEAEARAMMRETILRSVGIRIYGQRTA